MQEYDVVVVVSVKFFSTRHEALISRTRSVISHLVFATALRYRSRHLYRVRQNKISQRENYYISEMPKYFCTKFHSFVCHNTVH